MARTTRSKLTKTKTTTTTIMAMGTAMGTAAESEWQNYSAPGLPKQGN
jgi:hypothetical protein